jgi:hypothetical protein
MAVIGPALEGIGSFPRESLNEAGFLQLMNFWLLL